MDSPARTRCGYCLATGELLVTTPSTDRPMSDKPLEHAIVLFDGVCNLCNASVRFIIARDPHAYFQFASLDSEVARDRLSGFPVDRPWPDSILLLEGGRVHTRSTAALRIARQLRFPWPLFY